MTQQNFFWKKSKKISKNAEAKKKKKVASKTSLTNMSKSEKSAYFRHVFAGNFFWVHFSKLFQRIRNQREILRFWYLFFFFSKKIEIEFKKKIYFCSY